MADEDVELDTGEDTGARPWTYWMVKNGQIDTVQGGLPEETLVTIFVNGQELATLMCSPTDHEALAIGFLFNEGVISSIEEVGLVRPNLAETTVDVFLRTSVFNPPRRLILTAGCGGGITFRDLAQTVEPLTSNFVTSPEVIFRRMHDLNDAAQLYQRVRGVHTSILANEERALLSAEDIGRHNTIDKLAGKALLNGIPLRDSLLFTSGRISSEMLGKARQMGVPIVASRTAPTSITVELARAWKICVIGYLRQGSMRIYTHPARLGVAGSPDV